MKLMSDNDDSAADESIAVISDNDDPAADDEAIAAMSDNHDPAADDEAIAAMSDNDDSQPGAVSADDDNETCHGTAEDELQDVPDFDLTVTAEPVKPRTSRRIN